jgi:predicted O-methyltransferase YrrM
MANLKDTKPLLKDKARFLHELASGLGRAQIFLTAVDLNLFTTLQEPKTAEVLSEERVYHHEVLQKLLDVLTSFGLLIRDGDQYWTAPDMAPFLVEGSPYYARNLQFTLKECDKWMKLKQILQEGPLESEERQYEHNFDRVTIDWIARDAMLGRVQETLKIISEFPEFKTAHKMIDLGGGHGLVAIGCAQENPQLETVVFDQPGVVDITQEYINRYGMRDRVRVMAGDYTKDSIGNDYDLAFCALSFDGNREDSTAFYREVYKAMKNDALLIIQTYTIDDDRKRPQTTLIWDLKHSMWGNGQIHIHTNAQLFSILEESGFKGEKVIDMSESLVLPYRMIIARKTSCKTLKSTTNK